MSPEKQRLVEDLMREEADARRAAVLRAGGPMLRRRRWERALTRSLVVVGLFGILAFQLWTLYSPRVGTVVAVQVPAPPQSASRRGLTDDELLALFPDTPVGLVTLENGQKRLIFPRPGDAAEFVTRL